VLKHQPVNSQAGRTYNAYIHRDKSWVAHFHKAYELIYVFSGCMEVILDGRSVLLHQGDYALALSNQVHQYKAVGQCHYWLGVFSSDFVPEFHALVKGKISTNLRFRCPDPVQTLLEQQLLISHPKEQPPDYFQTVPCLLLVCGEYLKNAHLVDRDNPSYEKMNEIADYIAANFRSKLTLQDVATALGYDYYYVSRLFRKIFRVSFNDYVNDFRVNAAIQALRNTDSPITTISNECGFQSIRSFNDIFHKKTGTSPARYRKHLR